MKIAVIGGGFYGLWISKYLSDLGAYVYLFERNNFLMSESSKLNQARVHNGQHYPRSISTFLASAKNFEKFNKDFSFAVTKPNYIIYGIHKESKVNSFQFERINIMFNLSIKEFDENKLPFKLDKIDTYWEIEETYFDSKKLLDFFNKKFNENTVSLNLNYNVKSISNTKGKYRIIVEDKDINDEILNGFDGVVVSTYGNSIGFPMLDSDNTDIEFQVCELFNVFIPYSCQEISLTVIDGPYWSLTPWPQFQNFCLSHVKYTPLAKFNSYKHAKSFLDSIVSISNFNVVKKDLISYSNYFEKLELLDSKYVIKTIFKQKSKDSRPIMYRSSFDGKVIEVIGSKIDNVYETTDLLDDFWKRINAR